jgi:Helicase HerA, central domain
MTEPFYLGHIFDPGAGKSTPQAFHYDADDLTTHAVVVGMTGSGKTGLCIDLLEEAALNGVPALMIDPKGDITNTLLHFPELAPQDFQPWINPDQARRESKTVEQAAVETAALWKKGLDNWGITSERLLRLGEAAQFAIFTPGSDAGLPVSILASLQAPTLPWEENREVLRGKITGTVTALLGLVGFEDIDPVQSREHILLSNIFENSWKQGIDLDLGELILQVQNPPFAKLGVFEVDKFFPEKDRFGLAMRLNNILAAPSFQSWIEGQPLDIPGLLYTPDGRPRHSVFYIAHLSDSERMFFVTLLYSTVEAWMHSQPGTTSLRAILYFDEIYGYLPPISNPPSKQPMLRMLKQARAFGVGQVLVTQNPVDLDYKGLSNAGSWFVGKLQTDKDKQRLLDGLENAMAGGLNRAEFDRLISTLGKRVFLLHNVHAGSPQTFETRWAMNYLAGPLTRVQIPALNRLAGVEETVAPAEAQVAAAGTAPGEIAPAALAEEARLSTTRPPVPAGMDEYFLASNLTFTEAFQATGQPYPREVLHEGVTYRPALLARVSARFINRSYNLDYEQSQTVLLQNPDPRGRVRWEEALAGQFDAQALESSPAPDARFAALEAPLDDARTMSALKKDFLDWAYRSAEATVRANPTLKVYAGPQVSQADYRTQCAEAARQKRDAEAQKVSATFDKKIEVLQTKLEREKQELEQDQSELDQRRMEELGTNADYVFSLFSKRKRRLSTSLTKRRMTAKSSAEVKESKQAIAEYQKGIADLQAEQAQAVEEVNRKWSEIADDMQEVKISAYQKDVLVELFGVAWVPYHRVKVGEQVTELPGYRESMPR